MKAMCTTMSDWTRKHPGVARLLVFLLAALCGVVFARIPQVYDWELGFVAIALLQLALLGGDIAAGNAVRQDVRLSLEREHCAALNLARATRAVTRAMSTHIWTLGLGILLVAGPVFSIRSYPALLGVSCKILFLTLGLVGIVDSIAMAGSIRDVQESFLKDGTPFLSKDIPDMPEDGDEAESAEGNLHAQLEHEGKRSTFSEDASGRDASHDA